MRCLCGDYECSSCGPAQGVTKCDLHNKLACENCDKLKELYTFIDSYSTDLKYLSDIQDPHELKKASQELLIEMQRILNKL